MLLLDKLESLGPVMGLTCAALNCELAMVVVVVLGAVVVEVQHAHRGLEVGIPAVGKCMVNARAVGDSSSSLRHRALMVVSRMAAMRRGVSSRRLSRRS